MLSIAKLDTGLPIFQALSSEMRAKIVEIVAGRDGVTAKELAALLDVPVTTLTPHLRVLLDCQLIFAPSVSGRGPQKYYFSPSASQISVSILPDARQASYYRADVPIGQYMSFDAAPTCGLANRSAFIGQVDEPRCFAHPGRYDARILWFTSGYLEYVLPNFIPKNSRICEMSVSFEIASEAPGNNNVWPSDISFFLNGTHLGVWTSPGDYGDRRGRLNPDWWYPFLNQYGLLKKLTVGAKGCFMDEEHISNVTAKDLCLTDQSILRFRICVPPGPNARGCTLFGSEFGDHPQDLRIEIVYQTN